MRNKKDPIKTAVDKISGDIGRLSEQREDAVSAFRDTANRLEAINTEMNDKIRDLDALASFIAEKRDFASSVAADNERVRARILDIIGE